MSISPRLQRRGFEIKYVIETHLHADFVSGHQEIAARTGAQIIFGEKQAPRLRIEPCAMVKRSTMGKVVLRFIETPGHTPEGILRVS